MLIVLVGILLQQAEVRLQPNSLYMALIPLTAYIFFRNMTLWVRGWAFMSLHDLGKTTLETYLLQHHIWLTSTAKTLLTIAPDWPKLNFFLPRLSSS